MTITAKVIADSISKEAIRLTTLQLRYPKFIHGEFMTHRVFSRNASSSRAIPVERLIQDVLEDPAMPIHWGANQRGMQADVENTALVRPFLSHNAEDNNYMDNEAAWMEARGAAIAAARAFAESGYHKQIVNRLIEPYCHINVVVTSTEWSNFFALRDHPAAQPEMRKLAQEILAAMAGSVPEIREAGVSWHLPYLTQWEWTEILATQGMIFEAARDIGIRVSVARCARVSYMTHDGAQPKIDDDLRLYDQLVGAVPLHASPAEHQATPDKTTLVYPDRGSADPRSERHWEKPQLHGNFRGWVQYRKLLAGESQ